LTGCGLRAVEPLSRAGSSAKINFNKKERR